MLLKALPPAVAKASVDKSLPELYSLRNEFEKERILAANPEGFAEWRDLPGTEFMQRYLALRYAESFGRRGEEK
jgi:hypothetical protein